MGFFSWLFCSILVVALVLLLFPFSVRIEFEAGERGARALFFFFKKKVYECKKSWGKGLDERRETRDERTEDVESRKSEVGSEERELSTEKAEEKDESGAGLEDKNLVSSKAGGHPEQNEVESKNLESQSSSTVREGNHNVSDCNCEKDPVKSNASSESAPIEAVAKKPVETPKTEPMELGIRKSSPVVEVAESAKPDDEKPAEDKKPKKEKRKLSDREFWTILLTPDLDARAFRYVLKILGAVFSLFRIRFKDCFVEGIQTDYQTMGYIAAVNGFLKAYPYVGDWDLRMDWCREKELRAAGTVRLSITLLRVFCFVLETLVLAGILAFSFWRRRARVIKTNELPELGFVRKKILNIILED